MSIFEKIESEVRGYCRNWDTVFKTAKGATLVDENGRIFLDFFAGAGALNYGHNHSLLQHRLVEHLTGDGVIHSLDMYTTAKRTFLETFEDVILKPRDLHYKVMFPGPTGTNAVEAALKLARKVTGRQNIVSFTNGYHGMTLGSLAITGNASKRAGAGLPLSHTTSLPFDGYLGDEIDTLTVLERYLRDTSSGLDKPAAFVLETVQGEGGVNVASKEWLQGLAKLAKSHDVLLIVDDIQVGCGRTGRFFSFEEAGIKPDIVTLSKSISGFGLPFALTLFRPELDVWTPGEHNGTFRGFNLAFVTATEALKLYWRDAKLTEEVKRKARLTARRLSEIADLFPGLAAQVRGRGLIWAIEFNDPTLAGRLAKACFAKGLLVETAGSSDQALKLLPPLTLSEEELNAGLDIIAEAVAETVVTVEPATVYA